MRYIKIIAVFCFCLGVSRLQAQNPDEWPCNHNINHTSFSPTTVLRPPLKIKWIARTTGCFEAGPAVAERKVVIQDRAGYIFCLDSETGQQVWRHFVQCSPDQGQTGPCIWNGRAYAVFNSRNPSATGMYCFDLKTGKVLWKKPHPGITFARIKFSPQVAAGRLFFCANVDKPGGGRHALVQAWDAVTGDSLWTYEMWNGTCLNTTLVAVKDTIFATVGAGETRPYAGKTVAFSPSGQIHWSSTTDYVYGRTGNPQYWQGKLYFISSEQPDSMTVLDPRNGNFLLRGGVVAYSKAVAFMNNRYYSRGYGNVPRAHNLTTGAHVLDCAPVPALSGCSPPVAANGFIYTGFGWPHWTSNDSSGHNWVAFNEAGAKVWEYRASSNNCPSLAIAYNRLYAAGGVDGIIHCFENAP